MQIKIYNLQTLKQMGWTFDKGWLSIYKERYLYGDELNLIGEIVDYLGEQEDMYRIKYNSQEFVLPKEAEYKLYEFI